VQDGSGRTPLIWQFPVFVVGIGVAVGEVGIAVVVTDSTDDGFLKLGR
jgi:hypothetical protein